MFDGTLLPPARPPKEKGGMNKRKGESKLTRILCRLDLAAASMIFVLFLDR